MPDTRLDIGTIYISQQGSAFEQGCRDSYDGIEPSVGIYDEDPIPTKFSSQHIDQMTGHGIDRLVFDYSGWPVERGRVHALMDSDLIDQITVEPFLTKMPFIRNMDRSWKEHIMLRDLPPLWDNFLTRDNVATIDGRPVVSTWSFAHFTRRESDARAKLMDEFGSYEEFVDEMRSHLQVDGTDPFLVVGKGPAMIRKGSELDHFLTLFDGITTWFPAGPWRHGAEDSWIDILDRVEAYFENNSQFAKGHGLEFTPRVFPGYDERGGECGRQGDKYIPRRPARLQQLLKLAENYTTSKRIDIASRNDWTEGHQIEPGTFEGESTAQFTLRRSKSSSRASRTKCKAVVYTM